MSFFASRVSAQPIPLHTTTPWVGSRWGELKSLGSIRALPGGRVLADDPAQRRIVMFDSTLTRVTVVLDTVGRDTREYNGPSGGFIPYRGDSTFLADRETHAFYVLGPTGKIARAAMPADAIDPIRFTTPLYSAPGFDALGRLIYTNAGRLLRRSMASTREDTIATINRPDDWTVLPDGTVAIVRARDYHIDWLHTDGTMTSSPPMPWQVRDIPDAYPPIVQHQVLADLDGNVWILASRPSSPSVGPVFDVVNRKGEIFERVQLPSERELAGFGPGGVLYMRFHPGVERVRLEWARVAR